MRFAWLTYGGPFSAFSRGLAPIVTQDLSPALTTIGLITIRSTSSSMADGRYVQTIPERNALTRNLSTLHLGPVNCQ